MAGRVGCCVDGKQLLLVGCAKAETVAPAAGQDGAAAGNVKPIVFDAMFVVVSDGVPNGCALAGNVEPLGLDALLGVAAPNGDDCPAAAAAAGKEVVLGGVWPNGVPVAVPNGLMLPKVAMLKGLLAPKRMVVVVVVVVCGVVVLRAQGRTQGRSENPVQCDR